MKKHKRQNGQALVEFTLILPVLLLVILAIIDYGRVLFVFAEATNSLRNATRNAELVGFGTVGSWADCAQIEADALDFRWDDESRSLEILYYDTDDRFIGDGTFDLDVPDYACTPGLTYSDGVTPIPMLTDQYDVDNGDLMVLRLNARVNFITPFLSNIWSGLDMDFEARRSIVTTITLPGDSGQCTQYSPPYDQDSDYDGLCDGWEFRWFGCEADDGASFIYPTDDDPAIHSPLYPDDCDWGDLDVPPDGINDYIVPNLRQNATDDPDGDGCYNGCEEANDTKPLNDDNGPGDDGDGDGVPDGDEINIYRTSVSVNDTNTDGVPDGYDTDLDGLNDGEEIFVYNIHPYGPTNPRDVDLNDDGEPDGYDTDLDGLSDGEEVYGTYQSSPNHVHTDGYAVSGDPINGYTVTIVGDGSGDGFDDYTEIMGEDRDGNLQTITTVVNNAPNTNTTNTTWGTLASPLITDPGSMDTDGDGLEDHCEFSPFNCGILDVHPTDPRNDDTDGDLLFDGEELDVSDTGYRAGHIFSPNEADWDLDGVEDREEYANFADPRDANSDAIFEDETFTIDIDNDGTNETITCSDYLDDYTEIYVHGTIPSAVDYYTITPGVETPDTPDGNEDGIDSDGDNLSDCEEIFGYTTDPTNYNTDGDLANDDVDPAPLDPAIWDISQFTDDDGDGLPDGWEFSYFDEWIRPGDGAYFYPHDGAPDVDVTRIPPEAGWDYGDGTFATEEEADPDGDGCNNLCEFQRFLYPNDGDTDDDGLGDNTEPVLGTDPNNWDTDGDLLVDSCEVYPNNVVSHPYNANGAVNCTSTFAATNPRDPDSDDDGLTDFQELYPTANAANHQDPSGRDSVANLDNYVAAYGAMDPHDPDSDDDGLTDYQEAKPSLQAEPYFHPYGASNPNDANTDGDPIDDNDHTADAWSDYEEVFQRGTNPRNPDTDVDGIRDDIEFNVGTIYTDEDVNPLDGVLDGWDTDNDGLSDGQEYFGTGYTLPDNSGTGTTVYFAHLTVTFCDATTDTITLAGYRDDPDNGLQPNSPDSDYDSIDWDLDGIENTSIYYDTDGDTVADSRDFFMLDGDEYYGTNNGGNPTDPLNFDTDNDDPDRQLPGVRQGDAEELNDISVATDPLCYNGAGDVDSDGDGLTTDEEINGTYNPYTEPRNDTDPFDPDSDDDFMLDGEEILGVTAFTTSYDDTSGATVVVSEFPITNPNDPDTDGDGLPDGREWTGYYTGTIYDADFAGVKTNPLVADTDGDGVNDGAEMDLRVETGNTALFNPLDGQAEQTEFESNIPATNQAIREVLYAYWDPTLVDPDGLCPNLCQALVVADSYGIDIRESDNWLRLSIDANGNGGGSTDLTALFDGTTDSQLLSETGGVYEVWISIPYLAELAFHPDIEAITQP